VGGVLESGRPTRSYRQQQNEEIAAAALDIDYAEVAGLSNEERTQSLRDAAAGQTLGKARGTRG